VPRFLQNEQVQRVSFAGITPSISNADFPQWQLPVIGIVGSSWFLLCVNSQRFES
jgi:hypothetical protein